MGRGFRTARQLDAPQGEVIKEVTKRGIATLVLASDITSEVRELIWSEKIADYIIKDAPDSVDNVVAAMERLFANEKRIEKINQYPSRI